MSFDAEIKMLEQFFDPETFKLGLHYTDYSSLNPFERFVYEMTGMHELNTMINIQYNLQMTYALIAAGYEPASVLIDPLYLKNLAGNDDDGVYVGRDQDGNPVYFTGVKSPIGNTGNSSAGSK